MFTFRPIFPELNIDCPVPHPLGGLLSVDTHRGGGVPGSSRNCPLVVPEMTYPDDMVVRWVHTQGDLRWNNHQIYLSETLSGEPVGLRQTDDDRWDIYFAMIKLAVLDTANKCLIHLPTTKKQQEQKQENVDYQSEKVLPMFPV